MTRSYLTYILAVVLALTAFTGCKTTEANYRAAYDKAKTKGESEAVDREVYNLIAKEELPDTLTYGNVKLPVKRLLIFDGGIPDQEKATINRFNVVTAKFRQTFNARSMAARLKENGFKNAFVARDRENNYYVVAASVNEAEEAEKILSDLRTKQVGAVAPFPYIVTS